MCRTPHLYVWQCAAAIRFSFVEETGELCVAIGHAASQGRRFQDLS